VQLYTRDLVGTVTRPVKELKDFRKVRIAPGAQITVTFSLHTDDLKFYDIDMEFVAEPGEFLVMAGPNSSDLLMERFTLVKQAQ
jgi:beta-glucosidase